MTAGRAAAVLSAALAASAASAAELKIGVVNVDEIVARYKKAEDLKKAEEKTLAELRDELGRRSRELEKRIAAFDADPKAPGRREAARDLQLEKYVLELDAREFGRERTLAENRIRRRITDEIAAVCRRIGEREDYDLILKQSAPGRVLRSDRERVEAFELNPVLYAAASVDMTSRVLDVLEDAYRRGIKLVPDEPVTEKAPVPAQGAGPTS
ncbi:MAG: OmpH/Skp family outer membrane protein, partial [Planctomycetota bacterium]